MPVLSLRLPESLHRQVRELAAKDDVSINQFIALAVAEKASALLTTDYLKERGRRGSRAKFERVLAKVPDTPPLPGDELESGESTRRSPRPAVRLGGAKRGKPARSRRP
jgi:hypothetical protein